MVKAIISTDKAPAAIGPYSQAILVNGILYTSGQIPIHPETNEMFTDIKEATHQVMRNLLAILHEAEMDFANVVKTSIFLADMEDFQEMNKVYEGYFKNDLYPARETVAVKTLPKNAIVEISMVAIKV